MFYVRLLGRVVPTIFPSQNDRQGLNPMAGIVSEL